MGACVNLLFLGALCVGGDAFASREIAGEEIHEPAPPMQASFFQKEIDALGAAKAAFLENPTPESLRACAAPVEALLAAMGRQNAVHIQEIDEKTLPYFLENARAHREHCEQYKKESGDQDNFWCVRYFVDHTPLLREENDPEFVSQKQLYVDFMNMQGSRSSLFQHQNKRHGHLSSIASRWYETYCFYIECEAWEEVRAQASSQDLDENFRHHFFDLKSFFKESLLMALKYPDHEAWVRKQQDTRYAASGMNVILNLDEEIFKRNLSRLSGKFDEAMNPKYEDALTQDVINAYGLFDSYRISYGEIDTFFWAVEKVLFDRMLQEKEADIPQSRKLFEPLFAAWTTQSVPSGVALRDHIVDTLYPLFVDRSFLLELHQQRTLFADVNP